MTSGSFEFDDQGRRLFRPAPPEFPKLDDVYDLLDPAQAAIREFDRRLANLDRMTTIGRLFARRDAVHSSGAEGSTTTFTDLMEFESALQVAPDRDDAAIVSAVAATLEEKVDHDNLIHLVLTIHRRLFERHKNRMIAASAGRFKQVPNFVSDTDAPAEMFGYTKPTSVDAAMKDWRKFTLASESGTNELVRQILSHWMFEHIHPFPDGNGCIGRLLIPIAAKSKGLTRTACVFFGEAVHEEKSLYIEALKDARIPGGVGTYVRQMLSFLRSTASANIGRLNALDATEKEWKNRFATIRSYSIIHRLISFAITKPVFAIGDAQKELGIGFAAANSALRVRKASFAKDGARPPIQLFATCSALHRLIPAAMTCSSSGSCRRNGASHRI